MVSSVTASAEVVEVLPAASENFAEIDLLPSVPRSPAVTVRLTLPAVISADVMVCVTACAPAPTPPSSSWTVSPAATVGLSATVKVGLVMLVMLSVAELPESDAAIRSGVPPVGAVVFERYRQRRGGRGVARRIGELRRNRLLPLVPRSPAVTVRLTLPAVMSADVMVCVTACASDAPPSSSWTVSPAATVGSSATVKVGLVTSVMLSVVELPESDAATRSGVPPVGAVVSSVIAVAAAWS